MINSKALKILRRAVRNIAGHMPVRSLITEFRYRMVPDYAAGFNFDGTQKTHAVAYPLPARNAPDTQRTVYRRVKKNRADAIKAVKASYAR